ncbi:hypothetical protein [Planococcus salinus]|uniref:hypothetical protein n=1 Tax=Planococcus salinus TaxID=1848460 RepID=UPI001314F070|nr:hypothetical protein [Planococcus salinus]
MAEDKRLSDLKEQQREQELRAEEQEYKDKGDFPEELHRTNERKPKDNDEGQ